MNPKEQANLLKWDGARRGCYEVYYLKWNDPATSTAYWIRYTLTSPLAPIGPAYCELWGIFFDARNPSANFGLKQRWPIDQLKWDLNAFSISVGPAKLAQNACYGRLEDAAKKLSLEWNLTFDSTSPLFLHFPKPKMYEGGFPKTKVLSPHLDARFSGQMTVNGQLREFKSVRGQQTHIWGVKHALRWAWAHCNTFRGDDGAIFEALDAQIAVGPFASPHLPIFYLKAGGKEYWFNQLHRWFLNRSEYTLGKWSFSANSPGGSFSGVITTPIEAFVGVTYTDPDGEKAWCNNSKVSTIRLDLKPSGAAPIRLTSEAGCAAEYVDRKTYPEVKIWV